MDILCISDTHNKHRHYANLPKADMIIHSGDALYDGTEKEAGDFMDWFEALNIEHKIFVPGNHDIFFERFPVLCKEGMPSVKILIHDYIEIEGIKIFGSPYTPMWKPWAFIYDRKDPAAARKVWDKIPENLDILITHGPPKNVLDFAHNQHLGCKFLRRAVERIKPKYHIFGHIHEPQKSGLRILTEEIGQSSVTFVNATVLDEFYLPTKEPILITI